MGVIHPLNYFTWSGDSPFETAKSKISIKRSYLFVGVKITLDAQLYNHQALWLVIVCQLVVILALIGYTWLPTPLATASLNDKGV